MFSVGSMILSSFATNGWQLVLTQGMLQAVGSTMLFSSSTIFLDNGLSGAQALHTE